MINLDLKKIMKKLSEKRKVFNNEADFQHALAWEIHNKNYNIRLEKPFGEKSDKYLDILIVNKTKTEKVAIELKYKTQNNSKNPLRIDEENFHLKNQGAQDLARYDFCKDIQRLEAYKKEDQDCKIAFAIFLTNDHSYWTDTKRDKVIDKHFRIYENNKLKGKLDWNLSNGKKETGTTKGRGSIELERTYILNWEPYSDLSEYGVDDKINKFKYLLIEV